MVGMKIAIGTAQFGLKYGINNSNGIPGNDAIKEILKIASEAGINIIDTAPAYGNSEDKIGTLGGNSFRIVTKFPKVENPKELENCLKNSLAALKTNSVYGYLTHNSANLKEQPELWETLLKVRQDKLVEKIGFSVYSMKEIEELLEIGIIPDIVQLPYSLLDRKFEAHFPMLKKLGTEIHVRSVFLQGLYFMNSDNLPEKLKPLKTSLDELKNYSIRNKISMADLALSFVIQNPFIDYVITGIDSVNQLMQNIEGSKATINYPELKEFVSAIQLKNKELLNPDNWTKIIGVTQARIGSSRLPGKVLLKINDKTILQYHLKRAKESKMVSKWIVATTNESESDAICEIARKLSLGSFKGSTDDVLDRFYNAVKNEKPDYIVRLTSDCPLIDYILIDQVVQHCMENKLDYYSNKTQEIYPDGLDVEVFTFQCLKKAWEFAKLPSEREHVTSYIKKHFELSLNNNTELKAVNEYSDLRITVDEPCDFEVIKCLIENLGDDKPWKVYANYLLEHPEIKNINKHNFRNFGYMKSKFNEIKLRNISQFETSNEYRKSIHGLIPGGAHTYSKGDDQFPDLSPAAIAYGKDSHVWDADGNEYLDCSMGLTSVSLGHAYDPVLKKVREELEKGVNFQRPSVLEKTMAEKFISIVPGHDMVKFAKNGSTVTTAALKLARAKTGRKLVAFPGDHSFYSYDDWFIGTTACNKGVPEEISNLSVTFNSCNIDSLKELFRKYPGQIACVITEPEKNFCGNGCTCKIGVAEYLKQVIEITHENGALFVADEMITGFKTAFPGSMAKYGLVADLSTWGKGIANGFSFCALTGKKETMELGGITREGEEKVFLISTTHGAETHSLAAAIATIDEFQKNNVIQHNHRTGKKIIELCKSVIQEHKLEQYIEVVPCEWMPLFIFKDADKKVCQGFRTLFMQEIIKNGALFYGIFAPCSSHTEDDIYYFAKAFDQALKIYPAALKDGYQKYLVGLPAKPVFRKFL